MHDILTNKFLRQHRTIVITVFHTEIIAVMDHVIQVVISVDQEVKYTIHASTSINVRYLVYLADFSHRFSNL